MKTLFVLVSLLSTALAFAPSVSALACDGPGSPEIVYYEDGRVAVRGVDHRWPQECVQAARDAAGNAAAGAAGEADAAKAALLEEVGRCASSRVGPGSPTVAYYPEGGYVAIQGRFVEGRVDCVVVHFESRF